MEKTEKILSYLKELYPEEYKTALAEVSGEPFRVLIGTILSQRTNDDVTYPAEERLFRKYKNAGELARAPVGEIEKLILPVNFYKTKAKRVREVARIIAEKYREKCQVLRKNL